MNRTLSGPVRFSPRSHLLVMGVAIGLASQLVGCTERVVESSERLQPEPSWQSALASSDPSIREAVMSTIAADPSPEAEKAIEASAVHDPVPEVREQAVLAMSQTATDSRAALLREIAGTESDRRVITAAQTGLHFMYESGAVQRRSRLTVDYPEHFRAGDRIPLHVGVGSEARSHKARVSLRLPQGFRMAEGEKPVWKGVLDPSQEQDVVFDVIAPDAPTRGAARVSLSVAYDRGDVEESKSQRLVALDARGGHFEELPVHVTTVEGGAQ